MQRHLAVIGGSGLYDIPGLTGAEWRAVDSPWGTPSDQILTGTVEGAPFSFLPRHGRGHVHSPTTVPYRANIDALKRLGVSDIVSISACGSFREDRVPGDFVLVDQFIDRTVARDKSFFGTGCVAHVSLAKPTCADLRAACLAAAGVAGVRVHDGGTYLAMEGPQFSTIAESRLYRAWGCDVIGMTNMPEAKLAREAEILLCLRRDDHRFRQLAPRSRHRRYRRHPRHALGQRRPRPRAGGGPACCCRGPPASLPARVRQGPRPCGDDRPRPPRSGPRRPPRRCRGARVVILRRLALVLTCLAAAPAHAQYEDFVVTDGPLSDDDFYMLVACATPPGQRCPGGMVRWSPLRAQRITVGFAPPDPGYSPDLARHMSDSLDLAIRAINDAGAALHLERAGKNGWADIRIYLAPIHAGEIVTQTGLSEVDGAEIGAALFQIWWNQYDEITRGVIVMAGDIPLSDAYPVMLEELTQSMGLTTDIRNPYYETLSVFSEDSNSVTKLGPQDVMALRRHYPPL